MDGMDEINGLVSKFEDSLKSTFSSIQGWFSMVFGAVMFSDKLELIASFFVTFLLLDYMTGIFASWIEHKNDPNKRLMSYRIESKKLRSSAVKIIGYGLIMMFAYFLNLTLFVNQVVFFGGLLPISVFELALLGCAVIEFWSNIENIKRAGFDIVGKFSQVIKNTWLLIRQLKGEK